MWQIGRLKEGNKWANLITDWGTRNKVTERLITKALRTKKTAKEAPAPDTEIMACGCGGKGFAFPFGNEFACGCQKCDVETVTYLSIEQAIDFWDEAMGYTE